MKEKVLGYIDVKSASGVYFYAQSNGTQLIGGNDVLPFDKTWLNIGGGMNLKTGVFTAPKAGTYAFSFTILKNGHSHAPLVVHLRRNGIYIGVSAAGSGFLAMQLSQQSTIKLKKGDRIDLQKGDTGGLSGCNYCHHFAGWLLEEDLEL